MRDFDAFETTAIVTGRNYRVDWACQEHLEKDNRNC